MPCLLPERKKPPPRREKNPLQKGSNPPPIYIIDTKWTFLRVRVVEKKPGPFDTHMGLNFRWSIGLSPREGPQNGKNAPKSDQKVRFFCPSRLFPRVLTIFGSKRRSKRGSKKGVKRGSNLTVRN